MLRGRNEPVVIITSFPGKLFTPVEYHAFTDANIVAQFPFTQPSFFSSAKLDLVTQAYVLAELGVMFESFVIFCGNPLLMMQRRRLLLNIFT